MQKNSCPLPCTTFQYNGNMMYEKFYLQQPIDNAYVITLYYLYDSFTTVHEEYLVYDLITMIGSVGGTLGMCIGFSFTGMISWILSHILRMTKK